MLTVALVGADGAGKTTIAHEVLRRLPPPTRYLYMGVNLEVSRIMLPSTRLLLELKRMGGGPPDMSPSRLPEATDRPRHGLAGRALAGLRADIRFGNQIAEEWFRQVVSWYYVRKGAIVIFDRHFVWDYYSSFSSPGHSGSSRMRRWHDSLLRRLYPRPDLVICLDAPAEVLFKRKGGGTVEGRERRRQEYLRHGATTKNFVLVDVNRASELVVEDVTAAILRLRSERLSRSTDADRGAS